MGYYNTLDNNTIKKCNKCKRIFPSNSDFFLKHKGYKDGLEGQCKECRGRKFTNTAKIKDNHKVCSKCKRELPADTDHFVKCERYAYGVYCTCKECIGNSFTKYLSFEEKEGYKVCSGCWEQYLLCTDNFARDSATNDGYYSTCKKCKAENNKNWFANNAKDRRTDDKKKDEKNKEHISERHKKWAAKNKGKLVVIQQRRTAKLKKLPATLTSDQWEAIKTVFDGRCAYCGVSEADNKKKFGKLLEQDHFIPLSSGGEYTHDNIIPACRSCNSSKKDLKFSEWYKEQPYYNEERERKILSHLNYSKGKQQLTLLFKDIV